jgi:hypothetical protein
MIGLIKDLTKCLNQGSVIGLTWGLMIGLKQVPTIVLTKGPSIM